jgi:hypothetical protein
MASSLKVVLWLCSVLRNEGFRGLCDIEKSKELGRISRLKFWQMQQSMYWDWMRGQYCIHRAYPYLPGSRFPSSHLKLERSPGVMMLSHACGVVTVAQLSRGRCRYDPHFPPLYTFMTTSLFSCWLYSGKLISNGGADVSGIKKHLKQTWNIFQIIYTQMFFMLQWLQGCSDLNQWREYDIFWDLLLYSWR